MEGSDSIQTIICGRCSTVCDLGDNFCRSCGMTLTDATMPLKRESRLPAVAGPRVPPAVVRAVAVVAVGALTEMMARRLAREAGRKVTNVVRLPGRRPAPLSSAFEEPALISDTLYVRRVHMRR